MKTQKLPIYHNREDSKVYLELHANHSAWNLENPTKSDSDWASLVEEAVLTFEEETGTSVFLLGRSGRHVCVENNLENRQNYKKLRDLALGLEKEAIDSFNQDNPTKKRPS